MAGNCANCAASLAGRYCAACGQDSALHRKPIAELIHDAADQFLGLDSRTARTFWTLIARPGELTRAYIAGQRQRYVPALRLYLLIAVIFFVTLSVFNIAILQLQPYTPGVDPPASYVSVANEAAGEVAGRILWFRRLQNVKLTEAQQTALARMKQNLESQGAVASAQLGDRVLRLIMQAYADSATFNAGIQTWASRWILLMMPLFALMTAATRPGKFLLIDHFNFALHLHSFAFIALGVAVLFASFAPGPWVAVAALAALALYLFLSLRRAFALSILGTAWRAAALLAIYATVFYQGLQAAILLTMS